MWIKYEIKTYNYDQYTEITKNCTKIQIMRTLRLFSYQTIFQLRGKGFIIIQEFPLLFFAIYNPIIIFCLFSNHYYSQAAC